MRHNGTSMKRKAWIWLVVFVLGGFAVYDFWDGYHPAKSIAAGAVSLVLGLVASLFYGGWPAPKSKSQSDRTVI